MSPALVLALLGGPSAAATPVDPARYAVASPYRISASAGQGALRYRLRLADPALVVPETAEQHVEPVGDELVVTICDDCGREAPPGAVELQAMREPNPWVESDDPVLRRVAREAGGGSRHARMRRLVDEVRRRIEGAIDYSLYASARRAYDERRGDCTEYALLLAALARAAGYPARVVAGVAYGGRFVQVPHAFGPHMWVQVWTGERWRSYDAGLPDFDARHIALAVGDGSPEDFRHVMRAIATMTVVDVARLEE